MCYSEINHFVVVVSLAWRVFRNLQWEGYFRKFGDRKPSLRRPGSGAEPLVRGDFAIFFFKTTLISDLFYSKLMLLKRGMKISSAKT